MVETAEWPLVGRDEELALLADVVGGARDSLVVAGAIGVGKSRLVADLVSQDLGDDTDGIGAVHVRATRSMATIPFGPFAAWARPLTLPSPRAWWVTGSVHCRR